MTTAGDPEDSLSFFNDHQGTDFSSPKNDVPLPKRKPTPPSNNTEDSPSFFNDHEGTSFPYGASDTQKLLGAGKSYGSK